MVPTRIVDIRIYKLKPGKAKDFHRLVHEQSIPLVKQWGHDVLAYGPSLTDADSYFLIRAYDSIEQMQADQDAFYGSEAWKDGPREAIVDLIEDMMESVFDLSGEAVDAIRRAF
jgi:hypothetical protein